MTECSCEALLLGRESVLGSANEDSLASLIGLLTRRSGGSGRRYRLRCSRAGIDIHAVRRVEDEGFESDDDAVSHTSSDSASSCCLVDDHVLKSREVQATDSANSSGASDNDDADHSLTSSVDKQARPADDCTNREFYAFNDLAFCHTDVNYPKVLVLVIKNRTKCKKDELDSATGLEAVVFQCKSVENLRDVCASYKEFSRRQKMDLHFRYPHRRKDNDNSNSPYRSVFNELQKSMSTTSATANSPFFKTWITHVSGKPQPVGKENESKYNLVQRTDDDGVTHIEVAKAVEEEFRDSSLTGASAAEEFSGSSSIISISTPEHGNIFLTNDPYTSIHDVISDSSEIEGVIRYNDDDMKPLDKNDNKEVGEESTDKSQTPPQRPQRGKYVKKNAKKDDSKTGLKPSLKDRPAPKAPTENVSKQPGTHERVVRGQFIRVNVEQQARPSVGSGQSSRTSNRLFTSEMKPAGQMLSYPVWNLPTTQRSRTLHRSREDETDYRSSRDERRSYQRRSRSSGGGPGNRRGNSPPAPLPSRNTASPLTYRYIETPTANAAQAKPLTNRFFGKLKEIANINTAYVNTLSRRRNSSGDLATAQFYQYLEPALKSSPVSKSSTNLKSVIKKKNLNESMEPKKVTFSAYATVQVVD